MADALRSALVEAVMEADGGPDDEVWEAENMVDDILDTPSGRAIREEVETGRRAKASLRLIVMRHHTDEADIQTCDVCRTAVAGLK